jgi:hypothetical protein
MENLWPDLQETFYLLLGPYIASLLLPVFIGTGLLLAVLMSFSRFWRPKEILEVKMSREE